MIKYILIDYYSRNPRVSKDGKKYYPISHRSFQRLLSMYRFEVIWGDTNGTYLQKR